MDPITTIPLRRSTRERLRAFGRKGETYDALLLRMLDAIESRPVEFERVD